METNAERYQAIIESLEIERILSCPTCQNEIPYKLGPKASKRIAGNLQDRGIDELIIKCTDDNCGKYFLRTISREFDDTAEIEIFCTINNEIITILNALIDSLKELEGQNAALRTGETEAQQRHLQELDALRQELQTQIDALLVEKEGLEAHASAAQEDAAELKEQLDELQKTPNVQNLAAQAAAHTPQTPAIRPPENHFSTPAPTAATSSFFATPPPRAAIASSPHIRRPPQPQKSALLLAARRAWDYLKRTW